MWCKRDIGALVPEEGLPGFGVRSVKTLLPETSPLRLQRLFNGMQHTTLLKKSVYQTKLLNLSAKTIYMSDGKITGRINIRMSILVISEKWN